MTSLDKALRQFEATEANLEKLERLWNQIRGHISIGISFGHSTIYEELCLAFRNILPFLPAIDGYRVSDKLYSYNEIGQMRLDASDVSEISAQASVEEDIFETSKIIVTYRSKLIAKRRQMVRDRVFDIIDTVDSVFQSIGKIDDPDDIDQDVLESTLSTLRDYVDELDTLIGSDNRPSRWSDLRRHLHFGAPVDLHDIVNFDWPNVKINLITNIYGQNEPIPIEIEDLADIVSARPRGPVTTKIDWSVLSDEDFERLMFLLISDTPGYENPEWLQQTHAPDRGRDLSVARVDNDPLGGVRRYRTIIQCKHWLSRSVSAADIGAARSQMELWQPPRVDYLVMATTGRFTVDAIALVEQHNQSDRALHVSMWPDSHLERLLAARPHLIAQFHLRRAQ